MITAKYFVPAALALAALFAVSCDPASEPSVSTVFVTPTDNQRVPQSAVPVRVCWEASKCFVDSVILTVDGVRVGADTISPVPETCNYTWNATGFEVGSRPRLTAAVHFSYNDDDGWHLRTDSASIRVLVDTGGPELRIVSPQDGDTFVRGNVPIKVWARDTSAGMDRVEFLVDEALKGTVSSGEQDTWRYTWDASQAGPGSHAIKVLAYNSHSEVAVEVIGVAIRDTGSSGGPTYHHGYVDTSETWRRAGNPHIVDADVSFRNGARLTIEPGCVVKFDNFGLYIGSQDSSGLTAVGMAEAPILFTSNQPTPAPGDWTGIMFGAYVLPGTRLSYSTVEYAGFHGYEGAAISMGGRGTVEEISNCTIRRGGMYGVFCREYAGFSAFSNNEVTGNQGRALRVDAQRAELLGAGNEFAGNDSAGVELYGRVSTSTTWPDLGVPYVITEVVVGDSTNNPVLTIQPGTEIRFKNIGVLRSGLVGRNLPARIIADGSAGRITFTSASAAPAPGDFYGVNVYRSPTGESEFRNCDFSYGGQGGSSGCMLYVHDCSPVITGCDFGYSAGWGITLHTAQVPDTAALRQLNTFHDNGSGAINWIRLFGDD